MTRMNLLFDHFAVFEQTVIHDLDDVKVVIKQAVMVKVN